MRNWILGLLCLALVVFVAAKYQDPEAEGIDAELEALEEEFKAKNEAASQKQEEELQKEELQDLDRKDFGDVTEELQELYEKLAEDEAGAEERELEQESAKKRGWGHRWVPRHPRLPRIPRWPWITRRVLP